MDAGASRQCCRVRILQDSAFSETLRWPLRWGWVMDQGQYEYLSTHKARGSLVCAQTAQAVFQPLQVKNGNVLQNASDRDDEICYVRHVQPPFMCFSPYLAPEGTT